MTVLKNTKLLHEHTFYQLICVHACTLYMYLLPHGVNRQDVVLPKFGIKDIFENGAKFTHWMSQNLNSISFLWIDLTYKCFIKKTQTFLKCTY